MTSSFQRYLRAKRTVDDRALADRLVDDLRDLLAARGAASDRPLRVLEVGAGIGTMLARGIEWDLLPTGGIQYTAVDLQSENITRFPRYIETWAENRSITVESGQALTLAGPDRQIELELVDAEAIAYAEATDRKYDLVVGAALLDILDLSNLPVLLGTLASGGVYYFPITFDGGTRFSPSHPADRAVERHYHKHMDDKAGGSSQAGSEALSRLQQLPGIGVDAAGSDWLVRPSNGGYPGDEAYFLGFILDSIGEAVTEITDGEFEPLDEWLDTRRAQVDAGQLIYLTHQLDLLGTVQDTTLLRRESD
jgi:hypothetical protein